MFCNHSRPFKRSCKIITIILFAISIILKFFYSYFYNVIYLYSGTGIHSIFGHVSCTQKYIQCPRVYKYYHPVLSELNDATGKNISLESHPNLPSFFLYKSNLSSEIPEVQSIRWSGIHWQESWRSLPKFLLYSAHFDKRETMLNTGCKNNYIRILAVYDGKYLPESYSCLLYFDMSEAPVMTPVYHYDLIDWQGFSSSYLVPYIISCIVPHLSHEVKVPIAVSLVDNSCSSPLNILRVTGIPPANETKSSNEKNSSNVSIGICGPAIYYYREDFSHRLIEWIEIMHLIGASKIILYKAVTHTNVDKVLDYYVQKGRLKIISFHYPPPYLDEPLLRQAWTVTQRSQMFALENIYFTDCILRFKDEFDYLAHFDPDEVPILKKHKTLWHLLHDLRKTETFEPAFYHLKWKTFYPETQPGTSAANVSKLFYIITHNRRPKSVVNKIDYNGKSIYNTSQILAVYSHKPLLYVDARFSGRNKESVVNPSVAYTAHYRKFSCGSACDGVQFVEENFLLNKKNIIISRVHSVLKELNLK